MLTRPAFSLGLVLICLSVCTYAQLSSSHAALDGQQNGTVVPDPLAQFQLGPAAADRPEGLVHLDVMVTEPAGRYVAALQGANFQILDNGQPRKVVSFQAYGGAAPRPNPPVSVTLVLDTLGVPSDDVIDERMAVLRFLRQNGGHLPQPVSVLTLRRQGIWWFGGPSIDGNSLADSIARNRMSTWTSRGPTGGVDQGWQASQLPGQSAIRDGRIDDADHPAEAALQALAMIAAAERQQPERKLLLWIGPGWHVGSGNNPEEIAKSERDKQKLFDRIVWFSTLLRLARINLYSFSVGEVDPLSDQNGKPVPLAPQVPSSKSHPENSPFHVDSPEEADVLALNRKILAIESGGRVLNRGPDLVRQIADCVHDGVAPFYSLTFDPPPAGHRDEYHDLHVISTLPGLLARSSTGYYDQPFYTDAPDPATQKVTVAQLSHMLHEMRGEPGSKVAHQLSRLELTERVDQATVESWMHESRSKNVRETLNALAEESAFNSPPSSDIGTAAPPNTDRQQKMIQKAAEYLDKAIPQLPNFMARRATIRYEEAPPVYKGAGKYSDFVPLHVVSESKTTVFYRTGTEVADATPPKSRREDQYLTTYGTFGPIFGVMKTVVGNPTALSWRRWEKGTSGEDLAVFRYSIAAKGSSYLIGGCCLPDGDGDTSFTKFAGYHGEITVDPVTGTVFRIVIEADVKEFVPLDRAAIMVSYGIIRIGGKSYVCPVHSVGIWRARTINMLTAWDDTIGFLTWGPYATKLNDFRYDDYRVFRAESRLLLGSY